MAEEQREILRMFVRYAEMVNAQFGEMDYRLRIFEAGWRLIHSAIQQLALPAFSPCADGFNDNRA